MFAAMDADNPAWRTRPRGKELVQTSCRVPGDFLAEGSVFVGTNISSKPHERHVQVDDAVAFQVLDTNRELGLRGDWAGDWPGVVRPMLEWEAVGRSSP